MTLQTLKIRTFFSPILEKFAPKALSVLKFSANILQFIKNH